MFFPHPKACFLNATWERFARCLCESPLGVNTFSARRTWHRDRVWMRTGCARTLTCRALMPSGVSSPLRPRTGELCFCLLKRNGACAVLAGLLRAAWPSGCSCCCSVCLHLGKRAVSWVCQDPVPYPNNFHLGSFWCSSLSFSKMLFSGCGTDNECWFLHWLAILQLVEVTFAAAGCEVFPY